MLIGRGTELSARRFRTVRWKGLLRVPQPVVIFTAESIIGTKVGDRKGNGILKTKINTKNHVSCSEELGCFTKPWSNPVGMESWWLDQSLVLYSEYPETFTKTFNQCPSTDSYFFSSHNKYSPFPPMSTSSPTRIWAFSVLYNSSIIACQLVLSLCSWQ